MAIVTIGGQLSEVVLSGREVRSSLPLFPLHALGIAGGVGLLILAFGLAHGKRGAAEIAIAALTLIGAANLVYGLSVVDAAIALAVAGFIVANLNAFRRGSERSYPWPLRGHTGVVAGAALYALYAVVAMGATRGSEVDRLVSANRGLFVNAVIAATLVIGWAVLRDLLRPALPEDGHTGPEHQRAAAIVREHGTDSLDPFTLREDKAFFFEGEGFLAYRVIRETAVVSGDPVGPPGSAARVLAGFVRFAEERDWNVVVTAASGRHLTAGEELGLRALRIGEEAVVDPSAFSLEGRKIRKVRQSISRVQRHGWRVEVVPDEEVTATLDGELARVEGEWRSRQRRLIGFAMTLGRLAGPGDRGGGVYVLGRDPEGRLRSFLRFAPYRGGLSLDLMRRAADEPNGLTEALVVAAIDEARERGLAQVSLNFAGFAHVMAADAVLSRSQRLMRAALRVFHGRFQLERLVRFNAKFFPAWQPRYLLYDGVTRLPLSALRVLQAEAYLPAPAPPGGRGFVGRVPAPLRIATAAAAVCAALSVPALLIANQAAHAGPLQVSARPADGSWSFLYRGPDGPTRESALYLPQGRQVILRIVRPQAARVIHVDPRRCGPMTVALGERPVAARVVMPRQFQAELDATGDAAPPAAVPVPPAAAPPGGPA
jgi:lysyl-tRNA synthetase, class II